MRIIFSFLFSVSFAGLLAQGITISGRIVDAETLDPLPFAHIFIDQTTIVTVSDTNGEYVLEHVENGDYKIVFSYVGYEMHFARVTVNSENIRVSARLVPTKEILQSVEVRGTKDKEWEKQLKQFNRVFFGTNELAKECRILNPWVLDFRIDWDKTFRATASEPLKIENNAMGYQLECILQGFSFDKKGYKIKGLYKFEEVNTQDKKEAAKWTRNRRWSYQNSLRFLFKSILDNHAEENGFKLYYDLRPDLYTPTSGYFGDELGKTLNEYNAKDHVLPFGRPGYYKIEIDHRLQIHHTTQFAQSKTYRDLSHPVSWLEVEKGYILVSQDGNVFNHDDITTSGELYNNRVATMLPTNYSPGSMVVINYLTKRAMAKRLQEKVYLQTDKGIYYPGETVWMKAYANYANQSVKDSLSSVLHIDLIDASRNIIESKLLKMDSTFAWGDIELSENINPGVYTVRAYTRWMLNYGDDFIYYKPILVTANNVVVNSHKNDAAREDFLITISRDRFKWPGNLKVTAALDSNKASTFANCSVTVSPVSSQLPSLSDINVALFFPEDLPEGTLPDFKYDPEYDFTLEGQLYRQKRKKTTGSITVIRGQLDSIYHFRTNRKGLFKIEHLDFYDTTKFTFQARNKKGRMFGSIRLLEKEGPQVTLPRVDFNKLDLDSSLLSYPILIASASKPDSVVGAVERNEDTNKNIERARSNADHFLGSDELALIPSGTNIVDVLVGRVPGLSLNSQSGMLTFTGRGSTKQSSEPLIVVDGTVLNFSSSTSQVNQTSEQGANNNSYNNPPADIQSMESSTLKESTNSRANQIASNPTTDNYSQNSSIKAKDLVAHITVEYVSRVEVSTRGDARYGSGSSNGVIAIYTQKTPRMTVQNKMQSFIVEGYSQPKPFLRANFLSVNKSYNPTTLYWNPSINFSSHRATSFSFELPQESGKYLIRIEGMSSDGKPVSGAYVFNLEKAPDQTKARF